MSRGLSELVREGGRVGALGGQGLRMGRDSLWPHCASPGLRQLLTVKVTLMQDELF